MTSDNLTLSGKAVTDLREALSKSYGDGFDKELNDNEINHLGVFFLTCLAEGLKLEVSKGEFKKTVSV